MLWKEWCAMGGSVGADLVVRHGRERWSGEGIDQWRHGGERWRGEGIAQRILGGTTRHGVQHAGGAS